MEWMRWMSSIDVEKQHLFGGVDWDPWILDGERVGQMVGGIDRVTKLGDEMIVSMEVLKESDDDDLEVG
jgi:hypothetical protein